MGQAMNDWRSAARNDATAAPRRPAGFLWNLSGVDGKSSVLPHGAADRTLELQLPETLARIESEPSRVMVFAIQRTGVTWPPRRTLLIPT